jgi:hypothetical protein
MKKIQTILILFLLLAGFIRTHAQTATEIANAAKSGKAVFLVAYNSSGADADKAVSIANGAKKILPASTTVVKMNTTDAGNSALISKYRLTGTPLPLILVLDKNGSAAGGFALKDATSEKLADLIPSPKMSELLLALSNGKSVYVVVYKESMTSKKNIMDNCAVACSKMENKSVVVPVNMDDQKEMKLLKTLKYNPNATEPVTFVVNASGQVTGTYNGLTDVNNLVSSAKKVVSGGCCPGGAKTAGCN